MSYHEEHNLRKISKCSDEDHSTVLPKFFFSFSESLNAGQLRPSSTQGSYWHRVLVGVCFSQVFIHAVNKYLSSHDKRLEQEIFSFLILLKLEQLNTQRKWNIKKQ